MFEAIRGEWSLSSRRNLGLDVVRSIAILLVLVAHYSYFLKAWHVVPVSDFVLSVGGLGVELFFALSGFLIGRLLLDIAATEPTGRQLLTFLGRRWMRTLPLYYGWLLVLLIVMPPRSATLSRLAEYGPLTQNLAWPMPSDNFLPVSWSLTIEEWFYLLFGACAIASAALLRRRNAVWVAIVAFLVVPAALRWMAPQAVDVDGSIRQVVIYRLDAIVWGVIMADLTARLDLRPIYRLLMLGAGLAIIVSLWGGLDSLPPHVSQTFQSDLVGIGFALCLPAAELLRHAWRWFAAIARTLSTQSYALYLIHLSVLQALQIGFDQRHFLSLPVALGIALTLPFALSWLSFRFFESPILARRPPQRLRAGVVAEPVPAAVATGD